MAYKPRLQIVHHPHWKTPIPTVENRWDLLYSDYPAIYDEFASVRGSPSYQAHDLFDFDDKVVVDVGSGTGKSSLPIAKIAKKVIAVDVESSMLSLATAEARQRQISNITFVRGDARALPLKDDSVDIVMGITLAIYPSEGFRPFVREATRIVKNGGLIVTKDVAPGWYGGELCRIIRDDTNLHVVDRMLVQEFGFKKRDVYSSSNYRSVGKMLRTYGFIFGTRAIDYIIEHKKTSVKWKNRFHYKFVRKRSG